MERFEPIHGAFHQRSFHGSSKSARVTYYQQKGATTEEGEFDWLMVELGTQGWELVSGFPATQEHLEILYFKRPRLRS